MNDENAVLTIERSQSDRNRECAMVAIREWVAIGVIEPQDAVTAAEQGIAMAEAATHNTGG